MNAKLSDDRCTFAFPGTYGHECGAPAKWVAVKASTSTKSGVYYGRRCEACRQVTTGDNAAVLRFEPLDPAIHVNAWK